MKKLIGVVCLVIGVILLVWGHNMAQSIGGEMENTFTGSPGDKVMYYYIVGAVLVLFGAFQIFWPDKLK